MMKVRAPEKEQEAVVGLVTQTTTKGDRERLEGARRKIQHYLVETFDYASGFLINEKNVAVFERSLFDVLVAKYNFMEGNELCCDWQGKCFGYFCNLLESVCPECADEAPYFDNAAATKVMNMSSDALYACYAIAEPVFEELDNRRSESAKTEVEVHNDSIYPHYGDCNRFYDQ